MMKKQVLAAGVAALAGLGAVAPAAAEVTGNIGVASQYVFRGVVFGDPQVSGGIDYASESGIYAGTWISSAAGEQEVDFYGGWATDVLDLGFIYYYFPDRFAGTANATEVYAGLNLSALSLYAYFAPAGFEGPDDDEYVYLSGDVSLPLTDKASLTLHVGVTEGLGDAYDGGESTFVDYGITFGFGDLFISATATDFAQGASDENEPTFTVGYGWSFDDIL